MEVSTGGGKTALLKDVDISTLDGAKRLYNDVVRLYAENVISERNMRALVYALSNYLPFLRFEKDLELQAEIDSIKETLERAGL